MFSIYTSDLPPLATNNSVDICYADDVTQLITFQTKSERVMALRTGREIDKNNKYEQNWKIKTNTAKLKILPISGRKTADVPTPDETHYDCEGEGAVLGLKTTYTGYTKHLKGKMARAAQEL